MYSDWEIYGGSWKLNISEIRRNEHAMAYYLSSYCGGMAVSGPPASGILPLLPTTQMRSQQLLTPQPTSQPKAQPQTAMCLQPPQSGSWRDLAVLNDFGPSWTIWSHLVLFVCVCWLAEMEKDARSACAACANYSQLCYFF